MCVCTIIRCCHARTQLREISLQEKKSDVVREACVPLFLIGIRLGGWLVGSVETATATTLRRVTKTSVSKKRAEEEEEEQIKVLWRKEPDQPVSLLHIRGRD